MHESAIANYNSWLNISQVPRPTANSMSDMSTGSASVFTFISDDVLSRGLPSIGSKPGTIRYRYETCDAIGTSTHRTTSVIRPHAEQSASHVVGNLSVGRTPSHRRSTCGGC